MLIFVLVFPFTTLRHAVAARSWPTRSSPCHGYRACFSRIREHQHLQNYNIRSVFAAYYNFIYTFPDIMSADARRTARREHLQRQRDAADDGSTPPPRMGGGGSDEDEQSSGGHDGLMPRSLFSPMARYEKSKTRRCRVFGKSRQLSAYVSCTALTV